MNLNLTFKDALPLMLDRYYNNSGKASRDALAALKRMAQLADELIDQRDQALLNCGAPDDMSASGMTVSVGG
jgi:hypothetical protein